MAIVEIIVDLLVLDGVSSGVVCGFVVVVVVVSDDVVVVVSNGVVVVVVGGGGDGVAQGSVMKDKKTNIATIMPMYSTYTFISLFINCT